MDFPVLQAVETPTVEYKSIFSPPKKITKPNKTLNGYNISTSWEESVIKSLFTAKNKNDFYTLYEILEKHDCILAGGAITSIFSNADIKDFDIYCRNENSFFVVKKELETKLGSPIGHQNSCTFGYLSKEDYNAVKSYGVYGDVFSHGDHPINLVYPDRACGSMASILDTFDFTVCQGAYSFKNEEFYFSKDFFSHLSKRKLFHTLNRKVDTSVMFRVKKYQEKGFTINNLELLKIQCLLASDQIKTLRDFYNVLLTVPMDKSVENVRRFFCKFSHPGTIKNTNKDVMDKNNKTLNETPFNLTNLKNLLDENNVIHE